MHQAAQAAGSDRHRYGALWVAQLPRLIDGQEPAHKLCCHCSRCVLVGAFPLFHGVAAVAHLHAHGGCHRDLRRSMLCCEAHSHECVRLCGCASLCLNKSYVVHGASALGCRSGWRSTSMSGAYSTASGQHARQHAQTSHLLAVLDLEVIVLLVAALLALVASENVPAAARQATLNSDCTF
jgi:hypothetical protein